MSGRPVYAQWSFLSARDSRRRWRPSARATTVAPTPCLAHSHVIFRTTVVLRMPLFCAPMHALGAGTKRVLPRVLARTFAPIRAVFVGRQQNASQKIIEEAGRSV